MAMVPAAAHPGLSKVSCFATECYGRRQTRNNVAARGQAERGGRAGGDRDPGTLPEAPFSLCPGGDACAQIPCGDEHRAPRRARQSSELEPEPRAPASSPKDLIDRQGRTIYRENPLPAAAAEPT
jgi:hypothetical protein